MKANKFTNLFAAAAVLSTLTACSSIGDGNGPVSMQLVVGGADSDAEVFACQVSSPRLEVTFTNGTVGNFFNQSRAVTYSSSDPDVLAVSDGTFPSPDGQFFVPGLLIPIKPGTATITANYLNFSDSIDVTVSPVSIDLSPKTQTLVQGQSVFFTATAVLQGRERLSAADFSNLGQWTVPGAEEETSASTIDADNGLLSAKEGAEGVDSVEFAIDFCNTTSSVEVSVLNQTLETLRLVAADDRDGSLASVNLPPDASFAVRAIGTYSGGFEQDLTTRVSLTVSGDEIGFPNLRGSGLLTSFLDAKGQSATVSATFDPDADVEGDEIISAEIPFNVFDLSLDPDSLDITPKDALMLPNSVLQYAVTGVFQGEGDDVTWDLSTDVVWSSDEPTIAALLNSNGSRGLAISSATAVGNTLVAAQRVSGDGGEEFPQVTVTVGALDEDAEIAIIQALQLQVPDQPLVSGDIATIRALADIGPGDQTLGSQEISSGVVWFSSDPELAAISNASSSRGTLTVLTEQADQTVTLTAKFFDSSRQEGEVSASIDVVLNPSPAEEPEAEAEASE
ncbi:MAG: hypothetical protein ACSHXK_10660 [Oceanococcus sp.]